MKLIFISGPYRAGRPNLQSANIKRAKKIAQKLWVAGYPTICPHLNTKDFEYDTTELPIYVDGYLEIMERCDAVVALPGWRDSNGATDEVNQALLEQIPVYDMTILTIQEILEDLDGKPDGPRRDMATMLTGDTYSTADMDEIEMRR